MANIIAVGTTAASSSDITVAANTPQTVFLTLTAGGFISERARVLVQMKDASNQYTNIDELNKHRPALILDGPGIYRATRLSTGASCGVDLVAA